MLLLRGATIGWTRCTRAQYVSIHAPLARSNALVSAKDWKRLVSIHAPLARSNFRHGKFFPLEIVSIHAPLARSNFAAGRVTSDISESFNTCSSCEEQHGWRGGWNSGCCFNTCSSCEEQLIAYLQLVDMRMFQYMLLLRGATLCRLPASQRVKFQYMLLLRGATP